VKLLLDECIDRRLAKEIDNLSFQQHLPQFSIAVIVLQAPTNQLKDLRPLVPELQRMVSAAPKGQATWVSLTT
jgi:hypothetical protein